MPQLTIEKLRECKKVLDEVERKRPKIIINGVEYIKLERNNGRRKITGSS